MLSKLTSLLRSRTVRQSAITVTSTFASSGLGAVFYLLVARFLGSHNFGLFSLSLTILTLIVTVADVGMGQGLIRFVSQHRDTGAYFSFAKLALKLKLISGIGSFLFLIVFAQPLATHLFRQPDLTPLLPGVGFGVLAYLLFSFPLSIFQGLQKFVLWGGLQVGANFLRLIFLAGLFFFSSVTPFWTLFVFSLSSFTGFLVSWLWLDQRFTQAKVDPTHVTQFWNFNKWVASFMIVSATVSRLDTLITARFVDLSHLGSYSLAMTMSSFLPQLSAALGAVTSARFAGLQNKLQAKSYLKRSSLFAIGVSLGVSLIMIPTALAVIAFTGRGFESSLWPFLILLSSLFIFLATNPLRDNLLYFHNQPQFFFWVSIGQGLVLTICALLLIPALGIIGTAMSVLASHIFLAVVSVWYYFHLSRK